jgi:hypothetical protein
MEKPLFTNPEYVQGQIEALHALILGLAQEIPPERFRAQSIERLEAHRNVLINQPVSDARIAAIDAAILWVHAVT